MVDNITLQKYLAALLRGDRKACKAVIEEAMQSGTPANRIYMDIIWPVMVEVDNLWRSEEINSAQEHLATRINRAIVDQLQNKLPRKTTKNKRIVICCASTDTAELGAQMASDLFESDGWEVRFLGGGVCNDDILSFIHGYNPHILLIYGATPKNAPDIRHLIDTVRTINAWPEMRIMLSGGLFNRAEGLWEEIGADLFASSAAEAVEIASQGNELPIAEKKIAKRKKRKVEMSEIAD